MEIDNPERKLVQEKINKIEAWMIQKGIKKDGLTIWRNHNSIVSDSYPTNSGAVYIEDLEQLKEIQQ